MESYSGVFVCSTNLMDALDTASLRRFDLKVKFDYLQVLAAEIAFKQTISPRRIGFISTYQLA